MVTEKVSEQREYREAYGVTRMEQQVAAVDQKRPTIRMTRD
jgi:hypothetical protein